MERDLEIIYKAANAQQAAILKNILSDEGIESTVTNIALMNAGGEVPLGWSSAPCILVRRDDMQQAREIAEQFDRDLASSAHSRPMQEDDAIEDVEDVDDFERETTWPPCPECGEPRRGQCPNCGAFDAYFSPAEYMVMDRQTHGAPGSATDSFEVESPEDLYMCSVCDQAILPEPLRYCSACHHDFGDGLELEDESDSQETNSRVLLVVGILAALAIAGVVYTFVITR